MSKSIFSLSLIILLLINSQSYSQENKLEKPVDYFGFEPGADRELFNYDQLIEYLKLLDAGSDKLKLIENGVSPMGKTMYLCFISSTENISNLDNLQAINKELALNHKLSEEKRSEYFSIGKTFVLATLSMHSTEVGPTQASPLISYDLITTTEKAKLEWLDNTVYMFVPNHNPDGMDMIVNNYLKYKGTKNEGSSMPGVYHKYVGHDNNRDFVTLSQSDTKAIASIYNLNWFPQVMVEKHQMGSLGVRYFVPPGHDPIAENIDAGIWNWIAVFGSNMITDMTADNLTGVAQHYLFDDYWPGSTTTSTWKNTIGMLTEAASVKVAKPIYIEPNELRVNGKGLSEYKKSVNMPEIWEGGDWKLSDIVNYEISSTYSILKTASLYREDILKFRNDLCKKEVEKGLNQAPFHYILPKNQNDQSELVKLVELLIEHGIKVKSLDNDIEIASSIYRKGDFVISLAQPTRAFIKEILEIQKFPLRHYTPNGEIIKPYDITSWSLPLHRGLESHEINEFYSSIDISSSEVSFPFLKVNTKVKSEYGMVFPAGNNESFMVAFSLLADGKEVFRIHEETVINGVNISKGSFYTKANKLPQDINIKVKVSPIYLTVKPDFEKVKLDKPRIALVETWFHDMDAGWTRFVFDTYGIDYTVLRPLDLSTTSLEDNFDCVVFPSASKDILMNGKYKSGDNYYVSRYPAEFAKGMGKEGLDHLMSFLDKGGIIISWGNSTDFFDSNLLIQKDTNNIDEFRLPFKNIAKTIKAEGLYCPGSFVNIELKKDHPLTYGMHKNVGVFYRGSHVFKTSIPSFDMDRRIIADFPEENILKSGYAENEEKLANKAVMVWMQKGKGQIILMGFNPQFRASTQGTYKLLFNSLLLEKKE